MSRAHGPVSAPATLWRFTLCGLRVGLQASDAQLLARTQELWSGLFAVEPAYGDEEAAQVRVQVMHGLGLLPEHTGTLVATSAAFSTFSRDGGYVLASRGTMVEVSGGRDRLRCAGGCPSGGAWR